MHCSFNTCGHKTTFIQGKTVAILGKLPIFSKTNIPFVPECLNQYENIIKNSCTFPTATVLDIFKRVELITVQLYNYELQNDHL